MGLSYSSPPGGAAVELADSCVYLADELLAPEADVEAGAVLDEFASAGRA